MFWLALSALSFGTAIWLFGRFFLYSQEIPETGMINPFLVDQNELVGLERAEIGPFGWLTINPKTEVKIHFSVVGPQWADVANAAYRLEAGPRGSLSQLLQEFMKDWGKIYVRHSNERHASDATEALKRLLPYHLERACPTLKGRIVKVSARVDFRDKK